MPPSQKPGIYRRTQNTSYDAAAETKHSSQSIPRMEKQTALRQRVMLGYGQVSHTSKNLNNLFKDNY